LLEKYDSADSSKSQRDIANELGIPRSTLQHWLNRKDGIDADPEIVSFFESSVGTAFLHRLAIGAHFAMTMSGTGSIRNVCQFFELTGGAVPLGRHKIIDNQSMINKNISTFHDKLIDNFFQDII
jgi:hypothetical protein